MPEDCPAEAKQHMIDLVNEFREIVAIIPILTTKSDKLKVANWLLDIRKEMEEFREKYPDA